jgi:hypothetical protein
MARNPKMEAVSTALLVRAGIPLKRLVARRVSHRAEAAVLTETPLNTSVHWDRFDPTTRRFRLPGCKLW